MTVLYTAVDTLMYNTLWPQDGVFFGSSQAQKFSAQNSDGGRMFVPEGDHKEVPRDPFCAGFVYFFEEDY